MKILLKKILYLFFPKLAKGASILMYHSVDSNDAFFNVTPEDFEKQMDYINKKGFVVVSLSELIHKILNKENVSSHICITFDDGYKSVFQNALPVLKKYNMKATMFIAPALLGTNFTTSDKVTIEIINKEEFSNPLNLDCFEFMSHSYTHKELPKLDEYSVKNELRESINFFNSETPKIFAYPRGKYSSEVVSILEKEDWLSAVTTEPGLLNKKTNIFLIPRNFVGRYTSLEEFKILLSDGIYYYAKIRKWFIDLLKK